MFATLKTLVIGQSARAEEQMRDQYALELIDQKMRETEGALRGAKTTLATLIQRQRTEERLLKALNNQCADMLDRAQAAMDDGNDGLAEQAATSVAEMENEAALRQATVDRLEEKTTRLRTKIERGHRKLVELKQGAITARAMRREAQAQAAISTAHFATPAQEAQDLINKVIGQDDPLEMDEIMDDINGGLDHTNLADRMAARGYGTSTKSNAADVLKRLKK